MIFGFMGGSIRYFIEDKVKWILNPGIFFQVVRLRKFPGSDGNFLRPWYRSSRKYNPVITSDFHTKGNPGLTNPGIRQAKG
jgi:hypothetical protein